MQRIAILKRVNHVTNTLVRQRGEVIPANPEQEFDEFFRITCPRLVGQAYVYTGSLAQAQDLAHETLTRVWQRWDDLRSYDDPGAGRGRFSITSPRANGVGIRSGVENIRSRVPLTALMSKRWLLPKPFAHCQRHSDRRLFFTMPWAFR